MFSNQTIVEAAHALTTLGHSGLDRVLLELGLDRPDGKRPSLEDRGNDLAALTLKWPAELTPRGHRRDVAIVARAARLLETTEASRARVLRENPGFVRSLAKDGIELDPLREDGNEFLASGDVAVPEAGTDLYEPNFFSVDPDEVIEANLDRVTRIEARDSDPKAGTAIGLAHTFYGGGPSRDWTSIIAPIEARLVELDQALQELLPLAQRIADSEASVDVGTPGMGHNGPPADAQLTYIYLDEAAAASAVVKEQLTHPDTLSAPAISLSAKIFDKLGRFFSWSGDQARVFAEEAIKEAGKQTGKRAIDTLYFGKIIAAVVVACGALVALLHGLPMHF